ncbi:MULTISPECIES: transglutaminase-like domain-containing protein [Acinetobacter]|uniref:transglutaminase-like domain-containing protein n=1 Tax=Acinetobacter TaxID=469 RepID=UPI00143C464F|nr:MULTISPECIES: transglutaminase family protein [Acinetobacter]MDD0802153.1 transglutaminase family protein [Acinetobacter sp. Gutcm_16]NKG38168.1 transglutaminase [Acinetobacter johnsonii]
MLRLLEQTPILDYHHPSIQNLIEQRKWRDLDEVNKVRNIYNFVRDEVQFGYNTGDTIQASQVLRDGYGQCNTKATLLMALLRAVGVATRIHGFTIDKALQKGAIQGIWYKLSPKNILHSWVEVHVNEQWYILEGVILDRLYLEKLQSINKHQTTTFCGFGVFTENFENPAIDWNLNDTFIQDKGINQDFGLFDNPDDLYNMHQQELSPIQRMAFKYVVRHLMNQNVDKIRNIQEASL